MNQGDGSFNEEAEFRGAALPVEDLLHNGHSIAVGYYDLDGWLVIYVCAYYSLAQIVNTYFDGSAYFQNVRIPTFLLNGTNYGAFAMPSNQRSAKAVQGPATFRYELRMHHGHRPGWETRNIYVFADSVERGGPPLIRYESPRLEGDRAWVGFNSWAKVVEGKVYYTKVRSIWNEPNWEEASAKLAEPEMSVTLPEGVTVHYFAATDERGLMVSSEYLLVD